MFFHLVKNVSTAHEMEAKVKNLWRDVRHRLPSMSRSMNFLKYSSVQFLFDKDKEEKQDADLDQRPRKYRQQVE